MGAGVEDSGGGLSGLCGGVDCSNFGYSLKEYPMSYGPLHSIIMESSSVRSDCMIEQTLEQFVRLFSWGGGGILLGREAGLVSVLGTRDGSVFCAGARGGGD